MALLLTKIQFAQFLFMQLQILRYLARGQNICQACKPSESTLWCQNVAQVLMVNRHIVWLVPAFVAFLIYVSFANSGGRWENPRSLFCTYCTNAFTFFIFFF